MCPLMSYAMDVSVDSSGRVDLLPPDRLLAVPSNDAVVAPWLVDDSSDQPPTPPPKQPPRSFGFTAKRSFTTFTSLPSMHRHASTSNLSEDQQQQHQARSRPSESHSLAESTSSYPPRSSSTAYESMHASTSSVTIASGSSDIVNIPHSVRKTKSTTRIPNPGKVFNMIRKSRSRTRLASDTASSDRNPHRQGGQGQVPPLPNTFVSFLPLQTPPSPTHKKDLTRSFKLGGSGGGINKKSSSASTLDGGGGTANSIAATAERELKLDLDFADLQDYVNIDAVTAASNGIPVSHHQPNGVNDNSFTDRNYHSTSPSSGAEYNSDASFIHLYSPSSSSSTYHDTNAASTYRSATYHDTTRLHPSFSDPFDPHTPPLHIPPRTKLISPTSHIVHLEHPQDGDPAWQPPDSWVVNNRGNEEDSADDQHSSSDEDDDILSRGPTSPITSKRISVNGVKKAHRRTQMLEKHYRLRVYRANGTYHVVSAQLSVTVSELMPRLKNLLLKNERETPHRLYLKERGRERVLALTEKPANIVRRRLEQAGYDAADGLELLGESGLSYLLRFVFKSQHLGPAEKEPSFETYTHIDLSSKSLRTIPVACHAHAELIQSLDLSRNPMLEIPLDFIQSCTRLVSLSLVNMAIKKVPTSVRHCSSLQHLDISCNRISDLNDAGLDRIDDLETLYVQNNKMETLPWYFPRLRSLRRLNISNNKFKKLPAVLSEMTGLVHLDISFNMIQALPPEIGQLIALESFVIVGNSIPRFPDEAAQLMSLKELDCRRNNLSDITAVCMLPKLETLRADHNAVHALDLSLGPCMTTVDASYNDITRISLLPGPIGRTPYTLVSLDISYAKLSSLDDLALSQLSSLQTLNLDHNSFKLIPESLGELTRLVSLSCCYNLLEKLPASIGKLRKLEFLDAHSNSLKELPESLWNCGSLIHINLASNLLVTFHDPPPPIIDKEHPQHIVLSTSGSTNLEFAVNASLLEGDHYLEDLLDSEPFATPGWLPNRKTSATSVSTGGPLPPLAHSLEKLYLGENQITDDALQPLLVLRELRILNLSFNQLQDLPQSFFRHFAQLEQLYLSGNKLTTLPTEDLAKLGKLSVLYLNGNKLKTLPQELGKVPSLAVLDVGSNVLKYNINNWEFDWNWNFNKNLRYLNLSGNKRLQIKSDATSTKAQQQFPYGRTSTEASSITRQSLSGFGGLTQLRVLGLMDVTITAAASAPSSIDIPDENEDRRVRTSQSTVNGMAYGIADNLGQNEHLNMFDLVHEFRGTQKKEAIFAMFGRAQPISYNNNKLSKYLHDHFLGVFAQQLNCMSTLSGAEAAGMGKSEKEKRDDVVHAMRRTFLKLNKDLHDSMFAALSNQRKMSQASSTAGVAAAGGAGFRPGYPSLPSYNGRDRSGGASGIVIYFVDRTMYVANVGNFLAVVSRRGEAQRVGRKHDPFDRSETARIRAAEGWVSPEGFVNGEIDISRSFGFFNLLPVVNARPEIQMYPLSEADEFIIVGNRGLWDHVPFQTAVDIARSEIDDPMIAAQKLRDFAVSYGADGSTMIMVIGVGGGKGGVANGDPSKSYPRKGNYIRDVNIGRLPKEVDPPQGHLALAFTDITNSTHLWEVNPGMNTAMRTHNNVLRRQLRLCGGYEVKTEGDSFMCSFPTTLAAVWWCMSSQVLLLHESWPLEILECEDGKERKDSKGRVISRGLSVRMGIHCGMPLCETDPNTGRMDYFGPMVNRSARIEASANGGEIMCSADVIREINAKILHKETDTEYPCPQDVVDAVKELGVSIVHVGERKLKGLEVPEVLSVIYPMELEGRKEMKKDQMQMISSGGGGGTAGGSSTAGSRVQFSVAQMKELGVLVLRLEALSGWQIFRPLGAEYLLHMQQQQHEPESPLPPTPPAKDVKPISRRPASLLPTVSVPPPAIPPSLSPSQSSTLSVSSSSFTPSCPDELYLYGDPDVLLPRLDEKTTTDADLMMVLHNFSIRIENALANISNKFVNQTCRSVRQGAEMNLFLVSVGASSSELSPPMQNRVQSLMETLRTGQIDERTLGRLLSVVEDML